MRPTSDDGALRPLYAANVGAKQSGPLRGRVRWTDVVLALAIGAAQIVATYVVARHGPGAGRIGPLGFALLAAGPVALIVRRVYPGAVHIVVFLTTLAYSLFFPMGPIFLSLVVSFFTAVLAGRRAIAWSSLVAGYFAFSWLGYLLGREPAPSLAGLVGLAAWLLVLATVAEVVRMRRDQAKDVERNREEDARRRVIEERLRIARELHDVLAHSISLINVQAGVALHLMDDQPDQARSALATIKDASKEALGELRSVLGVLRQVDEGSPRRPAPGLARLDDLVTGAEAAGLLVRVDVHGERRALPAGVDLAAFRIVQEALTNAARHAAGATAIVDVAYGADDLTVTVTDDGGRTTSAALGSGSGIPGMRERVTALGGDFDAGPEARGGFRVRARFPIEPPT